VPELLESHGIAHYSRMPTKPKVQHWIPAPSRNSSRDRRDAQVVFCEDCPKDEQGNPLIVEIEYRGEVKPFDASGYAEYRDASPERIQQMFVDQIASNAIALAEMLREKRSRRICRFQSS